MYRPISLARAHALTRSRLLRSSGWLHGAACGEPEWLSANRTDARVPRCRRSSRHEEGMLLLLLLLLFRLPFCVLTDRERIIAALSAAAPRSRVIEPRGGRAAPQARQRRVRQRAGSGTASASAPHVATKCATTTTCYRSRDCYRSSQPNLWSPVHFATQHNNERVLQMLVLAQGDVNQTVQVRCRAAFAAGGGDLHLPQTNERTCLRQERFTPLHLAVNKDTDRIVEYLIQVKANIHALDEVGLTPLVLRVGVSEGRVWQ